MDDIRHRPIALRSLGGYSVAATLTPPIRGIPAAQAETDVAANASLANTVTDINQAGSWGTAVNSIQSLRTLVTMQTPTVPAPGAVNVTSSGKVSDGAATPGATANVATIRGLKRWQFKSPAMDAALRVGLPIIGYLFWRDGNQVAGGAAFAASAALWANKLGVIHV